MNLLDALTIVRNCSLRSAQMQTKQGKEALKVIDKKLQSLMRKKAWRDGCGAVPIHMANPDFMYQIPDAPPQDSTAEDIQALDRLLNGKTPEQIGHVLAYVMQRAQAGKEAGK